MARPVSADQVLHLPYASGTKIQIIQGYNAVTHVGVERYSLDLVRADGGTSGAPVFSPASGSVAWAEPPGGQNGCIGVSIDNDGDFHYMLCHIILSHAYGMGDKIQLGQALGTVGAPGLVGNNGTAHVHMQLYTAPAGVRTPQPYAPPDGIPLDGVTMPADGSFNQWGCSGLSCQRLVSTNPGSRGADAAPGTAAAAVPLVAGSQAHVAGTGDCLRVHAQPSVSSVQLGCLPDGTSVYLKDGPTQGDGYSWWDLNGIGWVAADYLQATAAAGAPPAPPNGSIAGAQPADTSPVLTPPLLSSADAVTAGGPAVAAALPGIDIGSKVTVEGTGDCLRLHAQPSLSSDVVGCLSDGSGVLVRDGPKSADGHTWWSLDAGGWGVEDYLAPARGS